LITNGFRKLLSSYTRIYNNRYNQSGSIFRQKTKNKSLSELQKLVLPNDNRDYYFSCFHYIHQNPLRPGLVEKLEDWEFSSFKDFAGLRNGTLADKLLATKYCGYKPDEFFRESYNIIPPENLR
jgi:putative transposase